MFSQDTNALALIGVIFAGVVGGVLLGRLWVWWRGRK